MMVSVKAGKISPGEATFTKIKCIIFDVHSIFPFNVVYLLRLSGSCCNPVKWKQIKFQNSIQTSNGTQKVSFFTHFFQWNSHSFQSRLWYRWFSKFERKNRTCTPIPPRIHSSSRHIRMSNSLEIYKTQSLKWTFAWMRRKRTAFLHWTVTIA